MSPDRRQILRVLGLLPAMAALGCPAPPPSEDPDWIIDPDDIDLDVDGVAANLEAVMDVILPAEWEGDVLVSPGAVEAGAYGVMQLENLVPLARAQGLLGALPPFLDDAVQLLDPLTQFLVSAELDAMAAEQSLFTAFRDLSRDEQEAAVADAFVDPQRRTLMELLRGICMLAYLGAIDNDVGLQVLGFPPFESLSDQRAVSGYPRTFTGRLVDAASENLEALAAAGELDDYTYNLPPIPTVGDDLSAVLDANGDFV